MNNMTQALIKLIPGILLIAIYTGLWINGMFINRPRGMDIITGLPLLVAGAFLILGWYKATRTTGPTRSQRWKFILSLLLVCYLAYYLLFVVSEMIFWPAIDFMSLPGIILPLLMGIFVTGFIISWKNEAAAGILFILWYIITVTGQLVYPVLLNRGAYLFIGIVIFTHGILYLVYHFRIKLRK
jgi:hypothetical protein